MLLKLFNGDDFKIYSSATALQQEQLPTFTGSEILPVEYTLMTRTEDPNTPWSIVEPSGYSLSIGLFNFTDRTQLAFQNTFSDSGSKKTGVFYLNTSPISTALTSASSVKCIFEVRIVDATGPQYPYRNTANLVKPYIDGGALVVPPTETALSVSTGIALFVPKDGSNSATPCDQIILKSRPSGLTKVLWIDDDGVVQVTNV